MSHVGVSRHGAAPRVAFAFGLPRGGSQRGLGGLLPRHASRGAHDAASAGRHASPAPGDAQSVAHAQLARRFPEETFRSELIDASPHAQWWRLALLAVLAVALAGIVAQGFAA